jgi:hypothetical protein
VTTTQARTRAPIPAEFTRPQFKLVKGFAAVGAGAITLQLFVYGRWLTSGPSPTPTGPDTVPGWMRAAVVAHEIASPVALLVCVYHFIVKPWKRARHLTLNGRILIACLLMYWQDLGSNYFNHVYTYNAAFVNFGSWYNFIPGWASPRGGHLVEPIIFIGPAYAYSFLLPALLLVTVMRRAKSRWPHFGPFKLVSTALVVGGLLDILVEVTWARLGLYTFTGTIPSLTIFSGRYYQFPVYEVVLIAILWTAFASLIHFRDDLGNTLAERGVDDLRAPPRQKSGLRFLAIVGYANVALFAYNVCFGAFTLFPSFRWAEDTVQNRSYLRNEVCGSGTTYACPGPDIPIPRRGGAHVDPNGHLVVPPGVELDPSGGAHPRLR